MSLFEDLRSNESQIREHWQKVVPGCRFRQEEVVRTVGERKFRFVATLVGPRPDDPDHWGMPCGEIDRMHAAMIRHILTLPPGELYYADFAFVAAILRLTRFEGIAAEAEDIPVISRAEGSKTRLPLSEAALTRLRAFLRERFEKSGINAKYPDDSPNSQGF